MNKSSRVEKFMLSHNFHIIHIPVTRQQQQQRQRSNNSKCEAIAAREKSRRTSVACMLFSLPFVREACRWRLERCPVHWFRESSVSDTSGLARGATATMPLPPPTALEPTKSLLPLPSCSASRAARSRGHRAWCIFPSGARTSAKIN